MISALLLSALAPEGLGTQAAALYAQKIESHLGAQRQATMDELSGTGSLQAHVPYLLPTRVAAFFNPTNAARTLGDAPSLIAGEKTAAGITSALLFGPLGRGGQTQGGIAHGGTLEVMLEAVHGLRDKALSALTAEERSFMFERVDPLVKSFWPQYNYNDAGKAIIVEDQKFFRAAEKIDWGAMQEAVAQLERLAQPDQFSRYRQQLAGGVKQVPGVHGSLIGAKKTKHGWIIIGDTGPNVYEPTEPTAIIIDLGGDDTYAGTQIGNSLEKGISLIYDRGGDDSYTLPSFSLACGRLGVSMVKDDAGSDTYTGGIGNAGTGFGGIGVLVDMSGDDAYSAERFSMGAAMAGLGLLWDRAGADKYSSDLFSMGVGGPLGAGALVDDKGDDHMRLGFLHPSGYNGSDAPDGPSNPNFQYEAWGLGMGIGRRVWPIPAWEEVAPYLAAGGIGIVLDKEGKDLYESSNFSLGSGYFFGMGTFNDMAGNDTYRAARYGLGSGAHYAMGFFGDAQGDDRYESSGPTYNCGCSWDRSIFWFADFAGDDVYDLRRSAGPGRGDIGSWGLAMDAAGSDTYRLSSLPGGTSRNGLGAFFDLAGSDLYEGVAEMGDGKSLPSGEAGLFSDLSFTPS